MLYRKISEEIEEHLKHSDKILVIEGARQTGKSFIIRYVCKKLFKHYVEVNLANDKSNKHIFEKIMDVHNFYIQLGAIAGGKLGNKSDTVIFLDEIQEYPHLISMLKALREEGRYTYIASSSLLGITLRRDTFIPIGSITIKDMYPLDFEEFLIANGVSKEVIQYMSEQFKKKEPIQESLHITVMNHFKNYLLTGGLPDNVNTFIENQNIALIRQQQKDIRMLYADDAARYEQGKKLHIQRIYNMLPSQMENKKKRLVFKDIEDNKNRRFSDYEEDFQYLIDSGIALDVKAISNPTFPLIETASKNLLKLYLNDVGLLTGILYGNNIRAILDDVKSINLGAVYETVVAQEFKAHGHNLFYYDNKKHGEVDFLIDDYDSLSVVPVEVKSGKDYTIHSSLSHFIHTPDYHISHAVVLNNNREVKGKNGVIYMPIYYAMFL